MTQLDMMTVSLTKLLTKLKLMKILIRTDTYKIIVLIQAQKMTAIQTTISLPKTKTIQHPVFTTPLTNKLTHWISLMETNSRSLIMRHRENQG